MRCGQGGLTGPLTLATIPQRGVQQPGETLDAVQGEDLLPGRVLQLAGVRLPCSAADLTTLTHCSSGHPGILISCRPLADLAANSEWFMIAQQRRRRKFGRTERKYLDRKGNSTKFNLTEVTEKVI